MAADGEWTLHENGLQRSVNDITSFLSSNSKVIWFLLHVTNLSPAYIGKRESHTVTAPL